MASLQHPILDRNPKLRAYADQHGLSCPDEEWLGWDHRYTLVCAQGHAHQHLLVKLHRVQKPCKACTNAALLAHLHEGAAKVGMRCLDEVWRGLQAMYSFRCAAGHSCTRNGATPLENWQCPQCRRLTQTHHNLRTDGLQALQAAAATRGGLCEAQVYRGWSGRYRFQCAAGHRWETTGAQILQGEWCPPCAYEQKRLACTSPDGLQNLQAAAHAKDGQCLSSHYAGRKKYYDFRCAKGHEWNIQGCRILRGAWCVKCAHDEKLSKSLADAQQLAHSRGGQCVSNLFQGSETPLSWQCHKGHTWRTTVSHVRNGTWCPDCAHQRRISNRKSKARDKYEASFVHGT